MTTENPFGLNEQELKEAHDHMMRINNEAIYRERKELFKQVALAAISRPSYDGFDYKDFDVVAEDILQAAEEFARREEQK